MKTKKARMVGMRRDPGSFWGVLARRAQSKTLASTMDVFAFPQKGQAASQQSQDESACYELAVQNTGTDPFQLAKQSQAQQQQAASAQSSASTVAQGSAVKGAAGGRPRARSSARSAAMPGKAPRSAPRRERLWDARGDEAQASAQQQVAQQSAANQQATAQQMENFKKAFSVCLEAKHYLVKY